MLCSGPVTYRRMTGSVLAANKGMLRLTKSLQFRHARRADAPEVIDVTRDIA